MNILARVHTALLYPLARVIVEGQSVRARVRSWVQPTTIHFEAPYNGERIVFVALYEKGSLRPDILRLLETAKAQGLYVLAVNTLKLRDPGALKHLIDCYIERPNFGRDFGSYKTGFLHVYARGWEKSCPRLVMINDSVYYATRGLAQFLHDLSTSEIEALGATENFEIEHHIGSFCIAFSGSVLRSARLRKYWKSYRLTDVRPVVIKRGEMRLSKTLKRVVSNPRNFAAHFNSVRFIDALRSSRNLQDVLIRDSRNVETQGLGGPRFTVDRVISILEGRNILKRYPIDEKRTVEFDGGSVDLYDEEIVDSRDALDRFVIRHAKTPSGIDPALLNDAFVAAANEVFITGSQIHQNAAVLLEIGLPIIKLDGMYRGMFNSFDLLRIQNKLDPAEASELAALILERPYGGVTLFGWKRAAFMRGLL